MGREKWRYLHHNYYGIGSLAKELHNYKMKLTDLLKLQLPHAQKSQRNPVSHDSAGDPNLICSFGIFLKLFNH